MEARVSAEEIGDKIKKMATEKIRSKLLKLGVSSTEMDVDRPALIKMLIERTLNPPVVEGAVGGKLAVDVEFERQVRLIEAKMRLKAEADAVAREATSKEATLAREADAVARAAAEKSAIAAREAEYRQRDEDRKIRLAEIEADRLQKAEDRQLRLAEMEFDRQQRADAERIRQAEAEIQAQQFAAIERTRITEMQTQVEMTERLRRIEIQAQADARQEEMRLQREIADNVARQRREESDRQQAREEAREGREQSLSAQTKRYGDVLKHVLPRMPTEPTEILSWWTAVDNMWQVYEVPVNLRSKLLLPALSPKARSLIGRLSPAEVDDIDKLKTFLMAEYKITSREIGARFNVATRALDETHTLFQNRLMNLWSYYLRSREVDTFDRVCDLIVADKLKDTLSGPCLKYCLGIEGHKLCSASELATLADMYDANYFPDGRYRGQTTQEVKADRGRPQTNYSPGRGEFNGGRGYGSFRPYDARSSPTENLRSNNARSSLGNSAFQGRYRSQSQPRTERQRGDSRGQNADKRCYICQSRTHLRNACPERKNSTGEGNQRWRPDNRPARVQACEVSTNRPVVEVENVEDSDVGVRVQANRCEVIQPRELNIAENRERVIPRCIQPDGGPVKTIVVSPLKYIALRVEGKGPIQALCDSGAEIAVLNKKLIVGLEVEKHGVIQLQGIFGDPVTAELTTLSVGRYSEDEERDVGTEIPMVFAVTDALSQKCDVILPTDMVELIKQIAIHSVRPVMTVDKNDVVCGLTVVDDGSNNDSTVTESTDQDRTVNTNPGDRIALINEQQTDTTLDRCRQMAALVKDGFSYIDSVLHHHDCVYGHDVQRIVVPCVRRLKTMQMAHSGIAAGHLAEQKTYERVRSVFWWPGIRRDISAYCVACKDCQLRRRAKVKDRVPIEPIIRPVIPFTVCHADVIGPIEPTSAKGHKYCLCIIDDTTRWPAVVLLKNLTAKAACDAFCEAFAVTGYPEILCLDNATNFQSSLTKEFLTRMGVAPRFNTPWHPESAGVIERFNGTFKNMLHHSIREYGKQWYRVVPFLVFALREVPNATTGVSPHMLLFGRIPRGPLTILKETWMGQRDIEDAVSLGKPITQYLIDLETDMSNAARYAAEHAHELQARYKEQYNRRAVDKSFCKGEQVIVLEKDSTHKTLAKWQLGRVTRVRSPYSYSVEMPDGSVRVLHANRIRKLIAQANHIGIIRDQDKEFGEIVEAQTMSSVCDRPSLRIDQTTIEHLSQIERTAVLRLIDEFSDVFSDIPGHCELIQHEINISPDFKPRYTRAYRVPEALRTEIERQVTELLDLGFIRPSKSPMSSGVVCVLKPDKSIRMCCDFRFINSFTVGDAFPMPNMSDTILRVGRAKYITVCDAKSGYYQLTIREKDRWLTAFSTHHGMWEWVRMPFGLKCAGNTFVRAAQMIIQPMRKFCEAFVDDFSIFSDSFGEHLRHLHTFLGEIRKSGMTLNLKKCRFAQPEVVYVGHRIGGGHHQPDPANMQAVVDLKPPTTKKQLRSLLGLLTYYRAYIKDFAAIAKPMTDLTAKRKPDKLEWSAIEQHSLDVLRNEICRAPIMATPDPSKPFRVYTDASAIAVGSQLVQVDGAGLEKVIAYASQKLTTTQCAWSTIEREAYAVIWSLNKWRNIIILAPVTVFSDHNPLKYITEGATKSAKLTRWALALQEYDLTLKYTKGCDNIIADRLSRL